ncbi:MAG: chromosome segregation protein SMC [Candidatus Methanomethylophilaceae archaeon]|nr:chromosome segregation protein SMC [Candidatus Methanomethylophilaceae archaeon]
MYLKQVELENFKSFGGKLTVPFMEGYTAVTGPNGSGKSNITDAILFVLGPKSSKAVRAGKLTDLIFDGGKSKNKAGYTRVSLVFDNTDRLMPWDDDVVRLTRFVKLSDNGVDYSSYFYINDRKSSMTEFDSLLLKARISADGYNLVQQGDVTRIVQMGAIERRRILDGISGIASFDSDIDKAKGERSEAAANLERITIITDELSKTLKSLERDRADAEKYIDAKNGLDVANMQLAVRRLQIEEAKSASLTESLEKAEADIKKCIEERAEMEKGVLEAEGAIRDTEAEIASRIGPEYREIKSKIDDARIDLATKRHEKETAEEDLEERRGFKESYEESIAANKEEIAGLDESMRSLSVTLDSLKSDLRNAEGEENEISRKLSEAGGEHKQLQERLEAVDAESAESSERLREASAALAKAESENEEASNALSTQSEKANTIDFEIKDAKWDLSQMKAESGPDLTDIQNRMGAVKKREAELERQETELEAAYRKRESEYNAIQIDKKASEKANRGSVAVEAILSLRNKGAMKGIHGTVQELASVEKEYETALSVAAGGKMQAVVVDDDQVAADAISYLKRERLGRVTFLPITKMMTGKPRAKALMSQKDAVGFAIDLIDFDKKYYNVFWYVLSDTLVVKDMDTARRIMGGIRIVTLQGEIIEASGAMVGGTVSQQNMLKFGAASEDKLAEAGERLRKAKDALDSVRDDLRAARDEYRRLGDELRMASSSGAEAREKIAEANGRISQLEKTRSEMAAALKSCKERAEKAADALEKARRTHADAEAEFNSVTDEKERIKARIAEIAPVELQSRMQAVRDAIFGLGKKISDTTLEIDRMKTESEGLAKQNDSYAVQLDSAVRAIADDEKTIRLASEAADRIKLDLDALRRIEAEMEGGIEDLRKKKEALSDRKSSLEADIREKSRDIETKTSIKESYRAQAIQAEANVREYKAAVDAITVPVPEPIPSEEELKRRIKGFEKTIADLGNVNLRSIEDYDSTKSRYDSLMSDTSTLNARISELNALMDDLSAKKKGLFMKSYDAVNENFKAIYAQLSGGGEAFMGLDDEDDPFAGGLMINAKPRNGKLLRLEALSGGEKSLTALSFIFAIQEYQPSPFYVLDEVDMFLDSVNAEMVAKRVKESSAKAQFIQVSLRKVTLALADHLIGVTRPPSGISKVIMQPDIAEVSGYEEEALKRQKEAEE